MALYSIFISYSQITEGNSSATKFLKYTVIGDDETCEVAFPRHLKKMLYKTPWMDDIDLMIVLYIRREQSRMVSYEMLIT